MSSETISNRVSLSFDGGVGLGVALAALLLYLVTLAPTVLEADSGEFQFAAWLPGIAHPTGYPLYILLGWLWSHIFAFGEVAWRMNLLSALLAAAAVGVTYGVARRLIDATLPETPVLGRIIAAAGAAATLAVSFTFWSQAVIAEVYALHALFVALLLGLTLKTRSGAGNLDSAAAKILTFTFGLSLTHHRTVVLLLPAMLVFVWWPNAAAHAPKGPQKSGILGRFHPAAIRPFIVHALLLTAPLLLYLVIPLIAPSTPYTTLQLSSSRRLILYDHSLQGFWDHVMGTIFTGELQPAAAGLDRLVMTGQLWRQQVGWGGIILAVIGLLTLWQRRQIGLLLLTGLGSLAFVAFNLIYFIGDVFVLFIPVWLFVALWVGLGGLRIVHWLARCYARQRASPGETVIFEGMGECLEYGIYRLIVVGLVSMSFLVFITTLAIRNLEAGQADNLNARLRWLTILAEPTPANAVLLSNDRNEIMPMWYYQYVEQRRPDLLGLFPLIVPDPAYANVGRVLKEALASERPVYLIKPMPGLSLKAELTPSGTLYRATPYQAPPTYPLDLALPSISLQSDSGKPLREQVILVGYDLTPADVRPGTEMTITLHWLAPAPLSIDYTSFVHVVSSQGQGVTQSDHRPGGEFYPSSYWQPGEILRDRHTLMLPADMADGVYQLRTGMYYQPEPGVLKGMGDGEIIGHLVVAK